MKYLIVLDKKFETLWGTLGPGVYEAEGGDFEPQVFEYTEGAHISVDIPRSAVRSIFVKDADCLKSHIQRNVDIESKLVDAGRELSQKNGLIEKANYTLKQITEILTHIDKEQGGFEVNPEYPIGSMDTIRAVLQNWRKEIKRLNEEVFQRDKEHSEVMDYLKEFLSGLGYETKGWADTEIADTLEDVLRDMKPIKQPVKVPADVAESLDKILTVHPGEKGYALVPMYELYGWDSISRFCLLIMHSDISTVSKWRDKNPREFKFMTMYGYVAEKTEREKAIEEIAMIMMGTHKNTTKELAEIVYDKFVSKGEQQ